MRALNMDFLHPGRSLGRLGAGLLFTGVVLTLLVGWRHYALAAEIDDLSGYIAETRRLTNDEPQRMRDRAGDSKLVAQEVVRANAVLASLTMPWDSLFRELESAATPNVSLLAIQPENAGRQIRVSGEARHFEDLLAYITKLEATPGFAHVYLVVHEVKSSGGVQAVAFSLAADWVGRP